MAPDVTRRFRIAFSFAGEQRELVAKVAAILGQRFGKEAILYDKFHEAEFARHDLGIYLPKLYRDQSDLVVAVLCPNYDSKQWTGWEWMAIYAQLTKSEGGRIMLTRFDKAHVDGLFDAAAFVELDGRAPEQVAELILERLALNEGMPRNHYKAAHSPSDPSRTSLSLAAQLEALFESTLCATLDTLRNGAVGELVAFLRLQTRLDGEGLVRAARFLIEHRLLTAEEPHCVLGSDGKPTLPRGAKEQKAESLLGAELEKAAPGMPFVSPRVKIQKPEFFLQRALERAEEWHRYFRAITGINPGENQTLCTVEVRGGAIAPHYLLAGLMSHFHDDWKPVISGYEWATHTAFATAAERVKASQWICWLVWGPSIPACTCPHWGELFAYQYGYGDENNSLPAVIAGAEGAEDLAKELRNAVAGGDRRATGVADLIGHLAWGPFALGKDRNFAAAQSRLIKDGSKTRAAEHLSEGLLIKVDEIEPRIAHPSKPAYFTAYIWLMFWIGRATADGSAPLRLNGDPLPDPALVAGNRKLIRKARLWEDLLPVFVHTNILDAVVLRLQKDALIENALYLVKRIWDENEKLRLADATKPAIEFRLVCASDWSGCGHPIKFPPPEQESLTELLRARLAERQHGEGGFAHALSIPGGDQQAADACAPAFRALLSSCHLPELIDDYYQYLQQQTEERESSG